MDSKTSPLNVAGWTPRVRLGQALFVLSDALDLVGVDDVMHGKRVAWLSRQLVTVLGEDGLLRDVHHAALVHDCGVSSTSHHHRLVAHENPQDDHAERGHNLLRRFGPLAHLAPVLRHHHTPWPALQGTEPRTALLANIIFLADRLDVLHARHHPLPDGAFAATAQEGLLGPWAHLFAPVLLEAARAVLNLADTLPVLRGERPHLFALSGDDHGHLLDARDARALALLFAQAVDGKSAFTARHSSGVAAVALHLARTSGQLRSSPQQLEVAALLHDLGKLHIPDRVLDKPGALTAEETAVIRHHARESRAILGRVDGFEDVARFAGMHHEFLDGTGYPDNLTGDAIPFEAQLLTVADIFQALAQDRPYRAAMEPKAILAVLRDLTQRGRINASLVDILEQDMTLACGLARVSPETSDPALAPVP